jgi:CheY-like chemotaxis protein
MKRILLVDDDAASCEAATAVLHDLECAVETVANGGEALKCLRRTVPDAVLVSLNISEMAEGAFVEACHHQPHCSDVPVVVMAVTPRAAVDAIRMGARGCVKKPVELGGLIATLSPLLQDQPRLKIATNRSPYATSDLSRTVWA